MAGISIQGTIRDQFGVPVSGMLVRLLKNGSSIKSTNTDGSGFYALDDTVVSSAVYQADPANIAPHYSDPGVGPTHEVPPGFDGFFTDDFTSTKLNTNPTRGTVGNKTYEKDSGSYTVDKTMGDADAGDVLTPVKLAGAGWGTLTKQNATTYRWTFNTAGVAAGDYQFQYRIEDDWGGSSSTETFTVTITEPPPPNNPPNLTNPGNKQYYHNTGNHTFQLAASDPDGDALTFSRVSGPANITISSSGLVTVKSNNLNRTTHVVTARVSDGRGGTDDETFNVEILNNPPNLTNPGSKQYDRGTGLKTFSLSASDADGDAITYSKVDGPAWVTLAGSTVTVDTDAAPDGVVEATWRASDGQGGTDDETHNITIGAAGGGFYQAG